VNSGSFCILSQEPPGELMSKLQIVLFSTHFIQLRGNFQSSGFGAERTTEVR
jgi:hypothetical protein